MAEDMAEDEDGQRMGREWAEDGQRMRQMMRQMMRMGRGWAEDGQRIPCYCFF